MSSAATVLMTPGQRARIFCLAKERQLSHAELRKMAPRGSMADLSYMEAHELLNQLGERRATYGGESRTGIRKQAERCPHKPRAAAGVTRIRTAEQTAMLESLTEQICELYSWDRPRFVAWLENRHHQDGRPMTSIDSARDGRDVIQLLTHTLRQARAAKARSATSSAHCLPTQDHSPHRRQRIAADAATS